MPPSKRRATSRSKRPRTDDEQLLIDQIGAVLERLNCDPKKTKITHRMVHAAGTHVLVTDIARDLTALIKQVYDGVYCKDFIDSGHVEHLNEQCEKILPKGPMWHMVPELSEFNFETACEFWGISPSQVVSAFVEGTGEVTVPDREGRADKEEDAAEDARIREDPELLRFIAAGFERGGVEPSRADVHVDAVMAIQDKARDALMAIEPGTADEDELPLAELAGVLLRSAREVRLNPDKADELVPEMLKQGRSKVQRIMGPDAAPEIDALIDELTEAPAGAHLLEDAPA